MSELKSNIKVSMGSEKSFGIILAVAFSLVGAYPLIDGNDARWWALTAALGLLVLARFAPKALSVPNKLWFKLGALLGGVAAPVVMAFVYLFTVAPTGLVIRLARKDLLRRKLDKEAKSYWVNRNQPVGSMKKQF